MPSGIALRHELNDFVLQTDHIGYGIRSAVRRRRQVTWAQAGCLTRRGPEPGPDADRLRCGRHRLGEGAEYYGELLDEVRETELGAMRRYLIKILRSVCVWDLSSRLYPMQVDVSPPRNGRNLTAASTMITASSSSATVVRHHEEYGADAHAGKGALLPLTVRRGACVVVPTGPGPEPLGCIFT